MDDAEHVRFLVEEALKQDAQQQKQAPLERYRVKLDVEGWLPFLPKVRPHKHYQHLENLPTVASTEASPFLTHTVLLASH